MKRFRPSLRRVSAFAGAAFAGAAATLFIATPAFAHHTNVVGVASCDPTGGWNVAWTVTSFIPTGPSPTKWDLVSISETTSSGAGDAMTGELAGPFASAGGTFVPPGFDIIDSFTGNQHLTSSIDWVRLTANGIWNNGTPGTGESEKIYKPETCQADPVVTFKDNCDGTVTVTLDNSNGTAPATFSITGTTDKTVNGGQKLDVIVPGNVQITVQTAGEDDWTHTWQQPTTPCPTTPVTGASVTGTIGLGAGLVAAGAVLITLLFVFRRRRTVAGQ